MKMTLVLILGTFITSFAAAEEFVGFVKNVKDCPVLAAVASAIEDTAIEEKKIIPIKDLYGKDLKKAKIGTRVSSSTGSVFERVERAGFGSAWQEVSFDKEGKEIRGLIWSSPIGRFTNLRSNNESLPSGSVPSTATEACNQLGAMLPSEEQFIGLVNKFDVTKYEHILSSLSDSGMFEFYRLFPGLKNKWFYTASFHANSSSGNTINYFNTIFGGSAGALEWDSHCERKRWVVCVSFE